MGYFRYTRKLVRGGYLPIDNVVVFFDIVDFATVGKTHDRMRKCVRDLEGGLNDVFYKFKWDEEGEDNDLILTSTGDGYAISFLPNMNGKEILNYVVELYKHIREDGHEIRFGISKGPNVIFIDLNDTLNIVGWGIVYAQRVMSLAEKNQILCMDRFAEPLIETDNVEDLKYCGKYPTKHGIIIKVYNYCKKGRGGFGSSKCPPGQVDEMI